MVIGREHSVESLQESLLKCAFVRVNRLYVGRTMDVMSHLRQEDCGFCFFVSLLWIM